MTQSLTRLYVGAAVHARARWDAATSPARAGAGRDRGDVPGWVLVTVMTAGLVAALWRVAWPLLRDRFTRAVNGVQAP